MTQKEFILETLLPYKKNPELCGYEESECKYLTTKGKTCAVGKWMKKGEWQNFKGGFLELILKYDKKDFFKEEALNQNFTNDVWKEVQNYHDNLALGQDSSWINSYVREIELELNVELKELYF